jgi:radical SAM superfamily enzyme YgiQ (UPF0313 family)
MVDTKQYHLEFMLKLKKSNRELTLATLRELVQNGYRTDSITPVPSKRDMIPAAGFYLTSLLRQNGYQTSLSYKCDDVSLQKIASENPLAVCLSSTMILSTASLISFIHHIREYLPETCIIVGGVYVWKSYQFNLVRDTDHRTTDTSSSFLFNTNSTQIGADIFVVDPHGRKSLLMVLKELERSRNTDFSHIPNLALPDKSGGFIFTERKVEDVDYNTDFTHWDLIDEMPEQIPVRTSIGCPYRCRFCDFYRLYPKIFMRSKESLQAELGMIQKRIGNSQSIVHASDDNVFINQKRVNEVTDTIISSGLQRWMGFMRASAINPANIEQIQRSGLLISLIGVESGDNGQLGRMNKLQELKEVKQGIELLDRHGITVLMTFIVGFPGETSDTISTTARFLNDLDIGTASSSYLLFPLVISPFSDLATPECRQRWNILGSGDNWSHNTMNSRETVDFAYRLFRQISCVPYHYTEERTYYNRSTFSDTQRKTLFNLRQKLTLAILDESPWSEVLSLLKSISDTMGFPIQDFDEGFGKEIVLS